MSVASRVLSKVFGTAHEREMKRLQPYVDAINDREADLEQLSDDALRGQTDVFRKRLHDGEPLDDLMVDAFATVREVAKRTLGQRHYDVQLIGGIVLHQGKIGEMKTGEGKTLAATLPVYLNALTGKGVHVVTVNDYLATRDAEWMGQIYTFLGLTVGCIVHDISDEDRKAAYQADVTYGTNNEFGFDYLRDNMKFSLDDYVQRPLYFAIVDEVDSILIDEARTPLIISGPAEESTDKYVGIDKLIPKLKKEEHYTVDEKARQAMLTDEGVARMEELLETDNLYDPRNIETLHHVNQALKAHVLFTRDVDYVVKDGEVIIVDEFTGRLMPGRRYSDGLHQALEAKEHVTIANENQTLASITFQNYFRMYEKLSGMTGTAETEAAEFAKIYNLDVVVIPTNKPLVRDDMADVIYKTESEKFNAVIEDIKNRHEAGQPILVGTISIEKSEELAKLLRKAKVPHHVLNAKHHEREAFIVAQAGRKGAVTISTNMAGRGTDIVLGGNPEMLARQEADPGDPEDYDELLVEFTEECARERDEVLNAGGLYILGTERHEARRIDNQLRGRSGRQGDPGASRFYLSLEDNLLRIFASERISKIMDKLGMEEGEPIEHAMVTRAIASAQRKVEGHNFEIRKHLLEYDDVMNQQRQVIYAKRRALLEGDVIRDQIRDMIAGAAEDAVYQHIEEGAEPDEWDLPALKESLYLQFNIDETPFPDDARVIDDIIEPVVDAAQKAYDAKEQHLIEQTGNPDIMRLIERDFMLLTLDTLWKDHLLMMDHLKDSIGLRGYGQKDPLVEYKNEGFQLFEDMNYRLRDDVLLRLYHVQLAAAEEPPVVEQRRRSHQRMTMSHGESAEQQRQKPTPVRAGRKVGRNDPCPCGSGKKYKKCCGAPGQQPPAGGDQVSAQP